MMIHRRSRGVLLAAALSLCLTVARGQGIRAAGGEMNLLGPLPGDQVWPAVALTSRGGALAWEDNMIAGVGGVGGAMLDAGFNAQATIRLSKSPLNDQIKPKVQFLRGGSNTVYVWESKVAGTPDIYARFASGGTFYTSDIRVNSYIKDQQVDPAVAALADGGAIVVWSSYGQRSKLWSVYARKLTAKGTPATSAEFLVNQFASNQRNPAVVTLANGNYVIAWVSEQERFAPTIAGPKGPSAGSVDIYARIFNAAGMPVTEEFLINSSSNLCANPALVALGNGGFMAAWSQRDAAVYTNGWDVWGRAFTAAGKPVVKDFRINTFLYGDQYRPSLAADPNGVLAVWTSMGEDGDHEGVYGRYLPGGTQVSGEEFQVNTTWINRQMHPAVAWNGVDRFLVVWTSFAGTSGFDLYGRMYVLTP